MTEIFSGFVICLQLVCNCFYFYRLQIPSFTESKRKNKKKGLHFTSSAILYFQNDNQMICVIENRPCHKDDDTYMLEFYAPYLADLIS